MNLAEFARATALMDAHDKGRDAAPTIFRGETKNPYPKEQGALREAWIDGFLASIKEQIE